jgi:ABC-2 type transport system permease protein
MRDATPIARVGQLTVATLLHTLLPLLVFTLTYASVAGEREQGTLSLLQSQGVAVGTLIGGKVLGALAVLATIVLPSAVVGLVALVAAPGFSIGDTLPRAAWLAAAHALYFGIFAGLGVLVSYRAPSSAIALLACLTIWTLSVWLVPRATSDLARRLAPLPSAFAFSQTITRDMQEGIDGHNPADRRLDALKASLLKQYNVERVEDLPVDWTGVALQAGEEHGNEVFDRRYAELYARFDRQARIYEWASLLSPTLALRNLSMGLAGTDWQQHWHFAQAAEAWRRDMVRRMNEELIYRSATSDYGTNLRGREVWETVPDFVYAPPPVGFALANHRASLLTLCLWAAAVLALLWRIGGGVRSTRR